MPSCYIVGMCFGFGFLKKFASDTRGSMMTIAALALPTLAFGTGAAVDMSRWYNAKATAQSAADATALAVVQEAALAGMDDRKINAAAATFARTVLADLADAAEIRTTSRISDATLTVDITVKSDAKFGKILGVSDRSISVSATARMMGKSKICLLALESSKAKALEASKSAKITAPECSFFVNSRDAKAIDVMDDAKLTAQIICSSGGYSGSVFNFGVTPRRDCPPISDPLANRAPPAAAHCDHVDRIIETGTVVLRPGVYCGGLRIRQTANVRLDPGIYVFRGSKLVVEGTATIEGQDVGLYFQDKNAQFDFGPDTTVSLSAPVSGPMAGILFYEDRSVPHGARHQILSNNAHTLLGTIYLPRGQLFIGSNRPIAQRSAYTIVIANQIEMTAGPELFLNANYGATVVPVPAGVGPVPGRATLTR